MSLQKARPLFLLAGLAGAFTAVRYLPGTAFAAPVLWGGLACIVLSCACAFLSWRRSQDPARCSNEALAAVLSALVSVGVTFLMVLRAALGERVGPQGIFEQALFVLGMSLIVSSGAALTACEARALRRDLPRDSATWPSALRFGLGGLLACALIAFNYAAARKDVSWNLSYLKAAEFSESTAAIARALKLPISVTVFLPQRNEVLELAQPYFNALRDAAPEKVKLVFADKDASPILSETLEVAKNGVVVFSTGGRREVLELGNRISSARKTLRNLDAVVRSQLLRLTGKPRVAYFTQGHGELSWAEYMNEEDADPRGALVLLEGLLRDENWSVKALGLAEGSASRIPADAGVVFVAGPRKPFLPAEAQALRAFLEGGGALFLFLDRDGRSAGEGAPEDPLESMLRGMGVRFQTASLADENRFIAAKRNDSDRRFLFHDTFSSHPAMKSLARNGDRASVLMYDSGALSTTPELGDWKVEETIRSGESAFLDLNGDLKFNPESERQDAYTVGAAVSRAHPEESGAAATARVLVLADANLITDSLLRNPANLSLVNDGVAWLVDEPEIAGVPASEEDVRIQHSRGEDLLWFQGTILLLPLLVLGCGWWATRRKPA